MGTMAIKKEYLILPLPSLFSLRIKVKLKPFQVKLIIHLSSFRGYEVSAGEELILVF
jgi:hypothetical protein